MSVSTLVGQSAAPEPGSDKPATQSAEEIQAKTKAQAVALLREVAEESSHMRLEENRAFFLTSAADLLWDEDEKGARDLFRYAMADVRSILSRGGDDDDSPQRYRRRMESGVLRQSLLMTIARHDPKVARDFLRETHELATAGGNEAYGPYGTDEQLELSLALEIAQNDPAQALEMGRQNLAKGFSGQLLSLAQAIYKKDPETANKFVGETIVKLKTANLNDDPGAVQYAISLFQAGWIPEGRPADPNKKGPALVDEGQMRDLAELIAQSALSAGGDESSPMPGMIFTLIKQLERYAPARVRQLRAKLGTAVATASEAQDNWAEVARLREEGTPDEILQAAEKAENLGARPMYYEVAVTKLIAAGELDRARSVIAEKITDPDSKRRLSAAVEQGALQKAATAGNLDESRRLLGSVKTDEERIMTLAQLATAVGAKDKKTALGLLQEATNMLSPRARNYRQLLARLTLVTAYATIGSDRAFDLLESSVEQSNEVLSAFFVVGEFLAEDEIVRDEEVTVFQLGRSISSDLQQYRKTVNLMATADFVRMKGVADRFQRPEIRLLARMMVADSILGKENEPASTDALPVPSSID
jgi:hypothetical protein